MSEPVIQLTQVERQILANQYRILSKVDPERARYYGYEEFAEILESGYEAEYGRVLSSVVENRLSVEDCRLVQDTLTMASTLLDHKGSSTADLSEWEILGFDGNNEDLHLAYAKHLYDAQPQGYPGIVRIVNNHRRNLKRYALMVQAWKQSERPASLTEADMARLITAGLNLTED